MDFDELQNRYRDFREFIGSWIWSDASRVYVRILNDEVVEEINELEFEYLKDEFRKVEKEYYNARMLRSSDI